MKFFFKTGIEYSLFYFYSFFSSFPINLYKQANKNSNKALSRIGEGLIINQRVFWYTNTGLFFIINNPFPLFLKTKKNAFILFYGTIQILLFFKSIYFYKLLKYNINNG